MDFTPFDKRGYPVVSAQTGYGEWAGHYDATVAAGLDRPLLDALKGAPWDDIKQCGSDPARIPRTRYRRRLAADQAQVARTPALARQFCVGLAHAQIRHANSPVSRRRSRHRQPRSQRPALLVISQHRKFLVRAIQNRARLRPPQLFTREHPLGHPVQIKLLEFQKLLSPLSRPGVHATHRSTSYMRRSAT
jgi:hypothetical protein